MRPQPNHYRTVIQVMPRRRLPRVLIDAACLLILGVILGEVIAALTLVYG